MNNILFFQTQQIPDSSSIFDQLKKQKQEIFFSYFQVDRNYYLFLYAQKSIQIDFFYQSIDLIQELDSKQCKIRSLRGFFLYALEIMETAKDYEILTTNLQPFFWRKVKNIIRQNKKAALHEFLFGKDTGRGDSYQGSSPALDAKIQNLQNQVESLQDRIRYLETQLSEQTNHHNPKYALSTTRKPQNTDQSIQQSYYTLKANNGPYLGQNHDEIKEPDKLDSKSLSEDKIRPVEPLSDSHQHNSNEDKGLHGQNFITSEDNKVVDVDVWQSPGNIPEPEQIEIIKTGFRLNQKGKISLKKYYESTEEYSLLEWKGYSIKYETIRRTKFYSKLKS